jgi:DNA repair exonuclease SbcCD ATPase subunit
MDDIQAALAKVEAEIEALGAKVDKVEAEVEAARSRRDDAEVAVLRKEKEQLRTKEEQLRKKEEQLRKKEEQLREEKLIQLRAKEQGLFCLRCARGGGECCQPSDAARAQADPLCKRTRLAWKLPWRSWR